MMKTRLDHLRQRLRFQNVDGFFIPRADEYQGEYVAPYAERLAYITGFTGSAGLALVLSEGAALFTDGRYSLQAKEQIDGDHFALSDLSAEALRDWAKTNTKPGMKIGFDPWLHSRTQIAKWRKMFSSIGVDLVALDQNPVDQIWQDQPKPPSSQIQIYDQNYAGVTHHDKRLQIAQKLQQANVDAAILTLPESIAWLLNIRGHDVPFTPFALSYAILYRSGVVEWFVDAARIDQKLAQHLGNEITRYAPDDLSEILYGLGDKKIMLDPHTAPVWFFDRLQSAGADITESMDPCLLAKATKNKTEIAGTEKAHQRDGAAFCKFWHWLEQNWQSGNVTEMSAAQKLESFRQEDPLFQENSFETISGCNAHGAIVHYRVTEESDIPLTKGLYLLDSGAQYLDGTTDITRTLCLGAVSKTYADFYTKVLKGHIALARAKFPQGTAGVQLDVLARQYLWQDGYDYAHGTGHGVGHFLSVHEGPQRISKQGSLTPLLPGMIISNEPGYYEEGKFGIRLENLILVREEKLSSPEPMLGFQSLTMVPFAQELIDVFLLTREEIHWLNDYHAAVREALLPHLDKAMHDWLAEKTKPLIV